MSGEVIHVRGEGGGIFMMSLPLAPGIAKRYEAGLLQRVNPDGSQYTEPAPVKRKPAPKAAAEGKPGD